MHKSLIRLLRHIDTRVIYTFVSIFVIPVCLFLNSSSRITYRYFRRQHKYGRCRSAWNTYRNHCLFAEVVVDKFAMYAGKKFHIDIQGLDHFEQLSQREEGFIILSSHVGNYEIAGYTLTSQRKTFNALVYFGEKTSVKENRRKLFSSHNINIIEVRPDMAHIFEIVSAVNRGEIVSCPADRIFGSEKKITADFLRGKSDFPFGSFQIPTKLSLSVISVFVMKTSYNKYRVFVIPLEYDKTCPHQERIRQLSNAYIRELENIVNTYPTQWYNYFEFFK
ncbi:MAG: lysophospholipid acyltransferase family protein [Bacteroidaceae bacterium]|nr:lysophospholipid acyltransferase family protein [Bacteroidaceae bacterium]